MRLLWVVASTDPNNKHAKPGELVELRTGKSLRPRLDAMTHVLKTSRLPKPPNNFPRWMLQLISELQGEQTPEPLQFSFMIVYEVTIGNAHPAQTSYELRGSDTSASTSKTR